MFENFANVWTVVGLARDLRADHPMGLTVAGERIVLFRGADGKPAALRDRCPHRGVALSLGRVRQGEIECPFHGWRFDAAGANCATPWNPDAKRQNLSALALPVREAGGLLWLYAGFAPTAEPDPSASLSLPGVALCAQSVVWNVHWTRVMENMLDMPHLPYVHRRSIGKDLARHTGGRMDVFWEGQPFGARIHNEIDGVRRPGGLEYRFPNLMELVIDPPNRVFRLMAVCLPQGETQTRLILLTLRSFARARLFDPVFHWMNRRIAAEDRAVVESSQPDQVPPPGEEKSVRTDAPTLAFRAIYRQRLLGSSAGLPETVA